MTGVLRSCGGGVVFKLLSPRDGVNPPGVPSRAPGCSWTGRAAPVAQWLRPPAFPASARGPRSAAGVPLRPGSAAGSARLRPATRSIRIAVPRAVHALAERSVRARPGGAVGGGAGPSPLPAPGAAPPRWKCGSFPARLTDEAGGGRDGRCSGCAFGSRPSAAPPSPRGRRAARARAMATLPSAERRAFALKINR